MSKSTQATINKVYLINVASCKTKNPPSFDMATSHSMTSIFLIVSNYITTVFGCTFPVRCGKKIKYFRVLPLMFLDGQLSSALEEEDM
jgi:hypothetical protein